MALHPLDLNLVPAPSLWERHHFRLGWGAVVLGIATFAGALGASAWTYLQARKASVEAHQLNTLARKAAQEQQRLEARLAEVDVGRELPRWRTAERVLEERALPWSRLISELEMDLPEGMRLRSIQRSRSREGVSMKLKGEARTRESQEAFVDALRANPVYAQVSLERESERQGGGWEFEMTLLAAPVPPPFKVREAPEVKSGKEAPAVPAPVPARAEILPGRPAPAVSTRTKPGAAPERGAPEVRRIERPQRPERPGAAMERQGRLPARPEGERR